MHGGRSHNPHELAKATVRRWTQLEADGPVELIAAYETVVADLCNRGLSPEAASARVDLMSDDELLRAARALDPDVPRAAEHPHG